MKLSKNPIKKPNMFTSEKKRPIPSRSSENIKNLEYTTVQKEKTEKEIIKKNDKSEEDKKNKIHSKNKNKKKPTFYYLYNIKKLNLNFL